MKRILALCALISMLSIATFAVAQTPFVPQPSPSTGTPAAADFTTANAILQKAATTSEVASAQDATAQAVYSSALQQNQAPLIIQGLLKLVSSYPASPVTTNACQQIAKFSEMSNRHDLAVPAYRAYLARRPQANDALQTHLRLADALRKTGRHEEAIQNYQLVMQRDTTRQAGIVAQDGLAQSLMALKRYKEAVDQIEQLLKNLASIYGDDLRTYSNLPVVLLNEGLCLEELGRYRDAIRRYGELRRVLPQSREAELAQARLDDLSKPLLTASPMPTPTQIPGGRLHQPGMRNQLGNTGGVTQPAGPGQAAVIPTQQPAAIH